MITVAQLVEDVAEITGEPEKSVRNYARALIDGGLLPKSRGRAIAGVEFVHVLRLLAAVAIQPKLKESAEVVAQYMGLKREGVGDLPLTDDMPETFRIKATETVEEYICDWLEALFDAEPENAELREVAKSLQITFVMNWQEIAVSLEEDDKRLIQRFRASGQLYGHWAKKIRRSTEIAAETFVWLGHNNNRDYRTGGNIV
ncbi:hypothetical protein [Ovoidimarina sediminis]|uniref:hypothetical protein n=1 Tax=Ovoidimarina sediminis TaxID=3079856 RepID=UPI00290E075E|nr:hypothetical protein [Rhodophyticola sp. MJ-SS7]MDU8946108.1 hypothetical protein [Rhodophyticola sp. MJ-SS7]